MSGPNSATDLWKYVAIAGPEDCWPWTRAVVGFGYGHFKVAGRSVQTNRLAYELKNGPIPDGLCVLHRCDNPPCCNPAHLFLGTRKENNQDRHRKGRNAKSRDLPTGDDHW